MYRERNICKSNANIHIQFIVIVFVLSNTANNNKKQEEEEEEEVKMALTHPYTVFFLGKAESGRSACWLFFCIC